jgi:hypothetical protein
MRDGVPGELLVHLTPAKVAAKKTSPIKDVSAP